MDQNVIFYGLKVATTRTIVAPYMGLSQVQIGPEMVRKGDGSIAAAPCRRNENVLVLDRHCLCWYPNNDRRFWEEASFPRFR